MSKKHLSPLNTKKSFTPALNQANVLSQVNPTDTDLDEDIFKSIAKIRLPDGVGAIPPTKSYLQGLPETLGSTFGVYLGSQSHPPCHRGVYWLIAQRTYKVAKDKVSRLLQGYGGGGQQMYNF